MDARPPKDRRLNVPRQEGESDGMALARSSFDPTTTALIASHAWAEKTTGEVGLNDALKVVREYADQAAAGDLDCAKRMLMSQAIALNAVFTEMTRKAADCLTIDAEKGTWQLKGQTVQVVMGIAMKAQSQCRTTLEALNELVNPRSVAFIKQANVANGPQQVNNGVPVRAEETEKSANKLLEANPSERLDFGTQAAAGGANQILEAVGAVNRAKEPTRQSGGLPKRAKARSAQR
jgi:hypothetical protein